MRYRVAMGLVLASLCCAAGVAGAKGHHSTSAPPLDGRWHADGIVKVAIRIADAHVGQQLTNTWEIRTACSKAHTPCPTTLSYSTGGHQIRVPLHGHKSNWSGQISNQTFSCTNGGTAVGSLAFKLHVTKFAMHNGSRVAKSMSATGIQSGSGCAPVIKLVVNFKVSRLGF